MALSFMLGGGTLIIQIITIMFGFKRDSSSGISLINLFEFPAFRYLIISSLILCAVTGVVIMTIYKPREYEALTQDEA